MKIGVVATLLLSVVGIGFAIYAFIANSSPYVTAKEALARPGTDVHIAGRILHDTAKYDIKRATLSFTLKDDTGHPIDIVFQGAMPGNFDAAPKASVAGAVKSGKFHAHAIKTQCPSKYEAAE